MKVYKKGQVAICPRCGKQGVRRLEKTCCRKAICKVCGGSRREHGPYWFMYHYGKDEDGSKQRRKYIGEF